MTPQYSVLYFKENLEKQQETIGRLLKEGIKVFWFGTSEEAEGLKRGFKPFADAFFLQAFAVYGLLGEENLKPAVIVDGQNIDGQGETGEYGALLDWLETCVPAFNAAQYRVEHCREAAHIVVKASAGTGKTTVMVDRILYLMHMVPGLSMSEIYMITFTNEATRQMNDRLQEMLLKKYSLTKNKRYLTWLEQQSQMHISTIDSLAYDLFRRFGAGAGIGRNLEIRPLELERRNLIKDLLSERLNESSPITAQTGMTFSELCRLIDAYWRELTMKGCTIREILEKDWGNMDNDPVPANFQRILREVLAEFEGKYKQLKLDENAVSIQDLFFDFGHYLLDGTLKCDGLEMRYLFVDEFQDTDATQIRTFARLVQSIGARLFVVGDVKQSIYSFKGATDAAFDILREEMGEKLTFFSLKNNYRTCANLMKVMEKYFFAWAKEGLLGYEEAVRPFNKNTGQVFMDYIENKGTLSMQTMDAISQALGDLELEVRSGRKKVTDKTKVAVLVRGNAKAAELAKLCRKHGKTVVLNSDRPFFLSQAVRDFYAMICSHLFFEQTVHMWNYLMTPYASFEGVLSVVELDNMAKEERAACLEGFVNQTHWHKYHREFRLRPVLAVIREMVEQDGVLENFIAMDKAQMQGESWTEAKKNRQALIDAGVYRKNLEKLMELIGQRMNGDFVTLYDLYVYLSLMIATNREEMEPDGDMAGDYTSVYIMTVHKSKGLEFDTVILPAMNHSLVPAERTGIFADRTRAAWYYDRNAREKLHSPWYGELRKEAVRKGMEEETRMLYVAMTRAVNRLVLLVNTWDNYESWSSLIRKAGLENE